MSDAEFLVEVKSRADNAKAECACTVCVLDRGKLPEDVARLLAMIEERDEKLRVAIEWLEDMSEPGTRHDYSVAQLDRIVTEGALAALSKMRGEG